MGTFDTFVDARGHEEQSKAFGQGMRTFHVGDAVVLTRAPFTESEHNAYLAGDWDGDPDTEATSYEVQCSGTTFACIRRGIFVGFTTNRDTNLPAFDYYGRDVTDLLLAMDDPAFVSGREQAVTLAWAHGLVLRAAYRDRTRDRIVTSETVNQAVACLLAHCRTYQCDLPVGVPEPRALHRFLTTRQAARYASARDTRSRGGAVSAAAVVVGAPDPFDVSTVPTSLFVLNEAFQVIQPYPTTVAALADDPMLGLQQVSDVFVEVLSTIRDMPDAGLLMRPTLSRSARNADAMTSPGWSGEERYTLYVGGLRRVGLIAVGPGWSGRARKTR